ncbi:glycerol-3-phosphate dehydrogenase [NAD(+)]-like [Hibiscus syriacus]|uniref:glycerol-3-phosphate dehydrogenase [NAD(+)]-like n=1 Tax=Hibiscus syriacus TaxID=106335 RepID=UPI00192174E5|nr:glycerol-3-phosphate dehydrogenase [NAD(+)]-like [Hibiscus syriacus]
MAPAFEQVPQDTETQTEAPHKASNTVNNDAQVDYKSRVTVVGSGNWGSVAAKLIASNTLKLNSFHGAYRYPDLENAVKDANLLVFVNPHQFMEGICKRLVGKVREDGEAISLIKGMEVKMEGPCMISTLITEQLGINCSVLMGANIANEIAVEKFSEATVGYRDKRDIAEQWVRLFCTPYFIVTPVQDVEGVELCAR